MSRNVLRMFFLLCLIIQSLTQAGCRFYVPYHTDSFSRAGIRYGTKLTAKECNEKQHSIWVTYQGAGDCLKYYPKNMSKARGWTLVYMSGDQIVQNRNQKITKIFSPSERVIRSNLEAYASLVEGRPFIWLARPGTLGSTGAHTQRRLPREVHLVNQAIDALKRRYHLNAIHLMGQSGGGHLVASLVSLRHDIHCAVATSGVVAVKVRNKLRGWDRDMTGHTHFYDPIDHIRTALPYPNLRMILIGDPRDRQVPFGTQKSFARALKQADIPSILIQARGGGRTFHELTRPGIKAAGYCLDGDSLEVIRTKISSRYGFDHTLRQQDEYDTKSGSRPFY